MTVRTESDGGNPVFVAAKAAQLIAAWHVPNLDDLVAAARCQESAVGTEGHGADGAGLAGKGDGLAAGISQVPNLDLVIAAAGSEPSAVGAKGDAVHCLPMPEESGALLTRCQVPEADGQVRASGGHFLSFRIKGHPSHH